VAKLVARLLATATLWVRIQTSLKTKKLATFAKERPTHSSPLKKKNSLRMLSVSGMWKIACYTVADGLKSGFFTNNRKLIENIFFFKPTSAFSCHTNQNQKSGAREEIFVY
jgi:hypothetical protein